MKKLKQVDLPVGGEGDRERKSCDSFQGGLKKPGVNPAFALFLPVSVGGWFNNYGILIPPLVTPQGDDHAGPPC